MFVNEKTKVGTNYLTNEVKITIKSTELVRDPVRLYLSISIDEELKGVIEQFSKICQDHSGKSAKPILSQNGSILNGLKLPVIKNPYTSEIVRIKRNTPAESSTTGVYLIDDNNPSDQTIWTSETVKKKLIRGTKISFMTFSLVGYQNLGQEKPIRLLCKPRTIYFNSNNYNPDPKL